MSEKENPKESENKNRAEEVDVVAERNKIADDLDVCEKAPEWAEHDRYHDEDGPCDDGRSGRLGEK